MFVVWDKKTKVFASQEIDWEKPLYYSSQKGFFIFGSELKALRSHPLFARN